MGSKGRRALGGGKRILKEKPLQKGFSLSSSLPLSCCQESGEKESKVKESILQSAFGCQLPRPLGAYLTARFSAVMRGFPCAVRRFFFGSMSAKKKLCKKKRVKRSFALCGARQGLCPLIPPTFEKVGSKLLSGVHKKPSKVLEFQEPFSKGSWRGLGRRPINRRPINHRSINLRPIKLTETKICGIL